MFDTDVLKYDMSVSAVSYFTSDISELNIY